MFDSHIAKMRREPTSILVFCLCIAIISAIDDLITSQFHPLMADAKEKNNNINHERKLLILAAAAAIPAYMVFSSDAKRSTKLSNILIISHVRRADSIITFCWAFFLFFLLLSWPLWRFEFQIKLAIGRIQILKLRHNH